MKINCALMFMISNHYGRKCLSTLKQLEPCSDMFQVICDVMANLYEMIKTIFSSLQFIFPMQ